MGWAMVLLMAQMPGYLGMSRVGEVWVWRSPALRDTYTVLRPAVQETLMFLALDTTLAQAGSTRVTQVVQRIDTTDVMLEDFHPPLLQPDSLEVETLMLTFTGGTVFRDTTETLYLLPFSVGAQWRRFPFIPPEVPVPVDLDGDRDLDTLTIHNDTIGVIQVDTLATSIGLVAAYRLRLHKVFTIVFSHDTLPAARDSMQWDELLVEWWVPDTGKVQDSLAVMVREWHGDTLWRARRVFLRELATTTPVLVPRNPARAMQVIVERGGVRIDVPSPQRLLVLDPSGRVISRAYVRERERIPLPSGALILHFPELHRSVRVVIP